MSEAAPGSRRGRLLVASPALGDPNFRRTVVLMLEHTPEGAVGLVLNRPTELLTREALGDGLGAVVPEGELIHKGGPVQPDAVIVLADFAVPQAAAGIAFGSVGIVDPSVDPRLVADQVRAIRAFGGYAGWSGGQLEAEIAEDAWIDAAAAAEDVFTQDAAGLWGAVLERKGGSFRLVARMPDDPSLN